MFRSSNFNDDERFYCVVASPSSPANRLLLQELESFIWRSLDVLRIFDEMRNDLECGDVPTDVDGAKSALEEHTKVKKRISKAPVEQLEQEGHQVDADRPSVDEFFVFTPFLTVYTLFF